MTEDTRVTLCTFLARHLDCNTWCVGFFDLSGQWHTVATCAGREQALHRVHVLHGGSLSRLDFVRLFGGVE